MASSRTDAAPEDTHEEVSRHAPSRETSERARGLRLVARGPQPGVSGASLEGRRSDIQGLRGVAVLLVVLFHSGLLLPGGFTGVDVFFVISGFVIAGSLVGELEASGRISLTAFYGRRVKRLLPGLALMLTFVVLAATLVGPAASQRTGSITGMFASLFAANVYLYSLPTGYFDVSTTLNPLLHTWTLAVEEQFYLVFPVLLLIGWRLRWRARSSRIRRATAVSLLAGLSVASLLYSLHLSAHLSPGVVTSGAFDAGRLAFYSAPARAWEFGVGALLFLASPLLSRLPPLAARILGLIGLGMIVGAALAIDLASLVGSAAVLPVLGSGLLIAAGTATSSGPARLLSTRALGWIGDRSYGWYLWHWPLIVFATALWPGSGWAAPLAATVSLLPTWLSFGRVENPIRYNPRLRGRPVAVLALICTAVPLAACGVALAIGQELNGTASVSSWRQSQALHADFVRGCDTYTPLAERTGSRCTWTVSHAHGQIVLFGDSNAGHFTEPVVRAGNQAGFDVTVVTSSGCPYIAVLPYHPCQRFARLTLDTLVRRRPNLVIIAARTDLYLDGTQPSTQPGATNTIPPTRIEAYQWQQQLGTILVRLNRAGVPVLLVHPVPLLRLSPPSCAVVRILTGTCEGWITRTQAERELSRAVGVENAAAATVPLTWPISMNDDLCSPSRCSTVRHGIVMYLNKDHLSIQGALTLTHRFAHAIQLHARSDGAAPHAS